MSRFKIKQSLLLLLAASIWGVAFVAQSEGMKNVEPLTFNGVRNILGALVLVPVIILLSRKNNSDRTSDIGAGGKFLSRFITKKNVLIIGGICCGVVYCIASTLQQVAIKDTDVGKAGFITAMYIVMVPIISILFKKKSPVWVYFSVILAFVGFFVMCMNFTISFNGIMPVIAGDFGIGKPEILLILSAFFFSMHILVIDYFSPKTNGVKLSCLQFLVCGIINVILMFVFENPTFSGIWQAKLPILYAGVMSCGVAYTLQIVGQKGINPTVASLILSLESVVSIIAGWLLLGEKLSEKELLGCAIIFAATILAQIPGKNKAN